MSKFGVLAQSPRTIRKPSIVCDAGFELRFFATASAPRNAFDPSDNVARTISNELRWREFDGASACLGVLRAANCTVQ